MASDSPDRSLHGVTAADAGMDGAELQKLILEHLQLSHVRQELLEELRQAFSLGAVCNRAGYLEGRLPGTASQVVPAAESQLSALFSFVQHGAFNVFVTTLSGCICTLQVCATDTPADVKIKIQKCTGIPSWEQRLLHGTCELRDETSLFAQKVSPLSSSLQLVQVAANKLYALGGQNDSMVWRSIEVFDEGRRGWSPLPSMASHRAALAAVAHHGKIYAIGGLSESRAPLTSVEVFDPITNAWHHMEPMPTPRSQLAAVLLEGKICCLGGYDGLQTLAIAEMFDLSSPGTWTALPPMALPRQGLAAGVLKGKIYATGGRSSNRADTVEASAEVFDPTTGLWSAISPMAVAREKHALAVLDGKLYVLGGCGSDNLELNSAEMFDPDKNVWTVLPPMLHRRQSLAAAVVHGRLWALGGEQSERSRALAEAFDPGAGAWMAMPSMSKDRQALAAVSVSER